MVTTFLLPSMNLRLRPTFLAMKPGTRIVANTFAIADWQPDESVAIEPCERWCTALLWIVPARVGGTWRTPKGDLTLTQKFQMVSGTLGKEPIENGRLRGDEISFTVGETTYTRTRRGEPDAGPRDGRRSTGRVDGAAGANAAAVMTADMDLVLGGEHQEQLQHALWARHFECLSDRLALHLSRTEERPMNHRRLSLVALAALVLVAPERLAPSSFAAQSASDGRTTTPRRTPDGRPDFQGVWVNNIATPLERPEVLAGRATLTDKEVSAMKKKAHELFSGRGDAAFGDSVFNAVWANITGVRSGFTSIDGETGDYSSVWTVERDWENRTSLITDPPDGRMPPLTPEGTQRRDASLASMARIPAEPADRALQERCITYGSPSLVAGYQSAYEIVQTPDTVALTLEMIHDTRVIPLNRRPHVAAVVRQWLGDSRGHWEGDTLVVETANYKPRSFLSRSSEQLHVVERFSQAGPDTLKYEITINDPGTWTRPWSLMIPLRRADHPMYEYGCHEGNYGMAGILAGARAEERAALSR